jgi:hypothetical protein
MKKPGGYAQTASREEKLGAVPAPGLSHISTADLLSGVKRKERSQPEPGLDVPSITGYKPNKPAVMPEGMSPASPLPDSGTAGLTPIIVTQENVGVNVRERFQTKGGVS